MTAPATPVVKSGVPWWVAILIGLVAVGALIWCFTLSRSVNRLEKHNTELVEWGREVQAWSVSVTRAVWGPGGDPCCVPPKPPPELE